MEEGSENDALLATEMDGGGVKEPVDLLGAGGDGVLLGRLERVDGEEPGIDAALVLGWIQRLSTTARSRRSV